MSLSDKEYYQLVSVLSQCLEVVVNNSHIYLTKSIVAFKSIESHTHSHQHQRTISNAFTHRNESN